jgi:hypothetical protein
VGQQLNARVQPAADLRLTDAYELADPFLGEPFDEVQTANLIVDGRQLDKDRQHLFRVLLRNVVYLPQDCIRRRQWTLLHGGPFGEVIDVDESRHRKFHDNIPSLR